MPGRPQVRHPEGLRPLGWLISNKINGFWQVGEINPGQLPKILRGASPQPAGRHLHWDELRHRTPPEGL